MCISTFIAIKPLIEQMLMEVISCQIARSKGDTRSSDIHYQQLLDIEQKCQEISGINYEYHNLSTKGVLT